MSDYPLEYQSPPRYKSYQDVSRSRSRSVSSPRAPSRSPTPTQRSPYSRRFSPSRSRSRESKRRRSISPRRRSRSPRRHRSPRKFNQGNKEFHGTRESPNASNILGVFGLSLRTRDSDIKHEFREFGPIDKVTIVYDYKSKKSRGFGFVYFRDQGDATRAREAMNGADIDGRKIRVDYSVTHRPHTPTPGEYMGERKISSYDRSYRHGRHRSPSPRRRYRSRSRSWSR